MSHVLQCTMFQCNAMEMYCNENVVHIQCIAICKFDIVQCLTKCTVLDWSEMFLLCKVQISNDSEVPGNAGGKPCYLPFLSITVSSLPGGSSGREGEKEIIFSSSSDHVCMLLFHGLFWVFRHGISFGLLSWMFELVLLPVVDSGLIRETRFQLKFLSRKSWEEAETAAQSARWTTVISGRPSRNELSTISTT